MEQAGEGKSAVAERLLRTERSSVMAKTVAIGKSPVAAAKEARLLFWQPLSANWLGTVRDGFEPPRVEFAKDHSASRLDNLPRITMFQTTPDCLPSSLRRKSKNKHNFWPALLEWTT